MRAETAFKIGQWFFRIVFMVISAGNAGLAYLCVVRFHSWPGAVVTGVTALGAFLALLFVNSARYVGE